MERFRQKLFNTEGSSPGPKMIQLISLVVASVLSLSPLVIKDTAFMHADSGEPFLIRGVLYQPTSPESLDDPLANIAICQRDVPVLKNLGVNTIYVKNTALLADGHGKCMQLFGEAGIYVLVDLPDADVSISDHYTSEIFQHHLEKANEFSQYNNTLGVVVAYNVTGDYQPYVKAAIRDLRHAMKVRNLPLGYSHADMSNKKASQVMMGCGERADFFALDISGDCELSSPKEVSMMAKDIQKFHGPAFFSGFGCRKEAGKVRTFEEASVIFSNVSGGFFNEYSTHSLLSILDMQNGTVFPTEEFLNAQKSIAKEIDLTDITPDHTTHLYRCTESSKTLPPAPNPLLCTCATAQLKCVGSPKSKLGYKRNETLEIYNDLCKKGFCKDIIPNPKKSLYPKLSQCEFHTQLSVVFNTAHLSGLPCLFKGFAIPVDHQETPLECLPTVILAQEVEPEKSDARALQRSVIFWPIIFYLLK